jgi:hypothetical protein
MYLIFHSEIIRISYFILLFIMPTNYLNFAPGTVNNQTQSNKSNSLSTKKEYTIAVRFVD